MTLYRGRKADLLAGRLLAGSWIAATYSQSHSSQSHSSHRWGAHVLCLVSWREKHKEIVSSSLKAVLYNIHVYIPVHVQLYCTVYVESKGFMNYIFTSTTPHPVYTGYYCSNIVFEFPPRLDVPNCMVVPKTKSNIRAVSRQRSLIINHKVLRGSFSLYTSSLFPTETTSWQFFCCSDANTNDLPVLLCFTWLIYFILFYSTWGSEHSDVVHHLKALH